MSNQQQWKIRRTIRHTTDAQRHWDLAYQCLLKWSQIMRAGEPTNESRDLCQSINPTSNRNRND